MNRLLIGILIFASVLFPTISAGVDMSTESGFGRRIEKEQSQSIRKSEDRKDTKGEKGSRTTTKGMDRHTSDTLKTISQGMFQRGVEVSQSLEAVFFDKIASKERMESDLFGSCRLLTSPKYAADFGLSAKVSETTMDLNLSQWFSEQAKANAPVRTRADESELTNYRDCMIRYGAIIGQAYLYLTQDLTDMNQNARKDKDGTIVVTGIGYDDFIRIAESALQRASEGIQNKGINGLLERAINDDAPCRFAGTIDRIQCGSSLINLESQSVTCSGVRFYGGAFGGFSGTFKLSKAWSYTDALEKLASTSRYKKYAQEVMTYAESLETKGRAKEAVLVRKKAFDIMRQNKNTISPSRLVAVPEMGR